MKLETTFLVMALVLLSAAGRDLFAASPRQELKDGRTRFEERAYDKAAEAFGKAAASAEADRLDPAIALLNQADALYKNGQVMESLSLFQNALRTANLDVQQRAYFNRGNALMWTAGEQSRQSQMDKAIQSVDEALAMYEKAMTLNPRDGDPKVNFELATLKKKELEELRQQQQNQQQQQQNQQDQQQKDQEQQDQQQRQKQDGDHQPDQGPPENQQKSENQEQESAQAQQQKEAAPQQATGEPKPSEDMTPEEALMMLEAMKQEEAASREHLRLMLGPPQPVEKDW